MNKKAKILVVDDEDNIRESLKEILTDEGYDIFLAQDAQIARKIKDNEKLDLILLDIWMPDCDGISLLKEWEKMDYLKGKKIKVQSGKETYTGRADGIDHSGGLRLKLRNGRDRVAHAGEVSLLL